MKPNKKLKNISLKVTLELEKKIDIKAAMVGMSRAAFIRTVLEANLVNFVIPRLTQD